MTESAFEQIVASANRALAHPRRDSVVGMDSASATGGPRFELYHSAPSLCSFKVRTVSFERGIPFRSHDMNIMPAGSSIPENYRPEYVGLRLQGAPNAKLVDGYTGVSSVATEGFDPCVVPTLVDHEKQQAVVDSARICEYLDREWTEGDRLMPEELAHAVSAQVDLVDRAPHVAVLYGAHPDGDNRPKGLAVNIKDIHAKKIAAVEAMMGEAEKQNAEETLAAYRAKITKESSANQFVYDAPSMRAAHKGMAEHVEALEAQLEDSGGPWALGSRYTMADIMWTNSLYRLKWLGLGPLWEGRSDRSRVAEYTERAFARPSFRRAVIEWPFAYSPSPHVKEFSGPVAAAKFFWQMLRRRPI